MDDTESDLIPFAVTASDHCGIHAALNIVGQKWALLIVRDVMSGITRFDHLRRHLGVSETVLSNRLRAMVHSGLLSQQEYAAPKERPRFEYVLTDAGWDLFPVLTALKRWGERHTELADGPYWMVEHAQCGARVTAQIACDSGHSPIPLTEISGRVGSVTAGVIDSEH